jgi:hypothetical protein
VDPVAKNPLPENPHLNPNDCPEPHKGRPVFYRKATCGYRPLFFPNSETCLRPFVKKGPVVLTGYVQRATSIALPTASRSMVEVFFKRSNSSGA